MVSVCIATHNGERFIKKQLDSILPQLGIDDEVIISDDGSTDRTLEIIASYNDSRIKIKHFIQPYKQQHSNVYASKNFENALIHSRGDYIFLCDQDDVWYDNKITVCLKYLQKYDLIQHNLLEVDNNFKPIGLHFKNGFRFKNYLVKGNSYHGCAMAFKRSVLLFVLPFPQKLALHDYWIGMLTEIKGNVMYYDKPLVYYRLHDNNISQHAHNTFFYRVYYRCYIIIHIILRLIK